MLTRTHDFSSCLDIGRYTNAQGVYMHLDGPCGPGEFGFAADGHTTGVICAPCTAVQPGSYCPKGSTRNSGVQCPAGWFCTGECLLSRVVLELSLNLVRHGASDSSQWLLDKSKAKRNDTSFALLCVCRTVVSSCCESARGRGICRQGAVHRARLHILCPWLCDELCHYLPGRILLPWC